MFKNAFKKINFKKAQEEIVGFALIIIIMAIVLLIFLSISIRKDDRETIESYEIESFIQALLQHSSECMRQDGLEFLTIQRLIFGCENNNLCLDGKSNCEILNDTINKILDESWLFGPDRPIKGRKMEILSNGEEILFLEQGNKTRDLKGAVQEFFRSGSQIVINYEVYY